MVIGVVRLEVTSLTRKYAPGAGCDKAPGWIRRDGRCFEQDRNAETRFRGRKRVSIGKPRLARDADAEDHGWSRTDSSQDTEFSAHEPAARPRRLARAGGPVDRGGRPPK